MALSLARAGSLKANLEYSDVADTLQKARKAIAEKQGKKGKLKASDTSVLDAPDKTYGSSPYFNTAGENVNEQISAVNLQATQLQSQAETDEQKDMIVAGVNQQYSHLVPSLSSMAEFGAKYDENLATVNDDINLQLDTDFIELADSGDVDAVNNKFINDFYQNAAPENKEFLKDYFTEKDGVKTWDWTKLSNETDLANRLGRARAGTYKDAELDDEGEVKYGFKPIFNITKADISNLDVPQAFRTGVQEGLKQPNATYTLLNVDSPETSLLSEGLSQVGLDAHVVANVQSILTQESIGINMRKVELGAMDVYSKYKGEFKEAEISEEKFLASVKAEANRLRLKGNFKIISLTGDIKDDKLKERLGFYNGLYIYDHSSVMFESAITNLQSTFSAEWLSKGKLQLRDGSPMPLVDNNPATADFLQQITEQQKNYNTNIGDGGDGIKGKFASMHMTDASLLSRGGDGTIFAFQPIADNADSPQGTKDQTLYGSQLYFPQIDANNPDEYAPGEAAGEYGAITFGEGDAVYSQGNQAGEGGRARKLLQIGDFPGNDNVSNEGMLKNELSTTLSKTSFGARATRAYTGYAFRNPNNGSYEIVDSNNWDELVGQFNNHEQGANNRLGAIVPVLIEQYDISNTDGENRILENVNNDIFTACTITPYNSAAAVRLTNNYQETQKTVNQMLVHEEKMGVKNNTDSDTTMTNHLNQFLTPTKP